MFGYRAHVFERYRAAVSAANDLAAEMNDAVVQDDPAEMVPELCLGAERLRGNVESFFACLPTPDLRDLKKSKVSRHLSWLDARLGQKEVRSCLADPRDIGRRDLPERWQAFESWYLAHSRVDEEFARRINELLEQGRTASAVRDGWPIFKTRIVEMLNLPGDLDGDGLVSKVFGAEGKAREILPDNDCETYLNLFKALYQLSRNPLSHNDMIPDQQEAEAALMLMNSALANLDGRLAQAESPPA